MPKDEARFCIVLALAGFQPRQLFQQFFRAVNAYRHNQVMWEYIRQPFCRITQKKTIRCPDIKMALAPETLRQQKAESHSEQPMPRHKFAAVAAIIIHRIDAKWLLARVFASLHPHKFQCPILRPLSASADGLKHEHSSAPRPTLLQPKPGQSLSLRFSCHQWKSRAFSLLQNFSQPA